MRDSAYINHANALGTANRIILASRDTKSIPATVVLRSTPVIENPSTKDPTILNGIRSPILKEKVYTS